jgi:hypothetical protein
MMFFDGRPVAEVSDAVLARSRVSTDRDGNTWVEGAASAPRQRHTFRDAPHRAPPARRIGPRPSDGSRHRSLRTTGRPRAPVRDDLPERLSQAEMVALGERALWGPEWSGPTTTADFRLAAQRMLGPNVNVDAAIRPYGTANLTQTAGDDPAGALAELNLRNRQYYATGNIRDLATWSGTGDPVSDPKFYRQDRPLPSYSGPPGSMFPRAPGDPVVLGSAVWSGDLSAAKTADQQTAALRRLNELHRRHYGQR